MADFLNSTGLTQVLRAVKSAIPTTLAALSDDSTHRLVTDTEKAAWNNKIEGVSFNGVPATITNKIAAITAAVPTKHTLPDSLDELSFLDNVNVGDICVTGDGLYMYTVTAKQLYDNRESISLVSFETDYFNAISFEKASGGDWEIDYSASGALEFRDNKVQTINQYSTHDQYPTALAVWNLVSNAIEFDTVPTENSTKPVTSGGLYTVITNNEYVVAAAINRLDDRITNLAIPNVPAWALATTKPSYTLDEVLDGTTRYLQNKTSINMGGSPYLEITVTDTCILKLIIQLSYDGVYEEESYHEYLSCMYELAISITSSEDWAVSGSILSGSNFLQEYSYQYGGQQRAPILCSYNNGELTVQLALDRELISYEQNIQATADIVVVLGKTSLSCTATSFPISGNGAQWNKLNSVITDIETENNSLRLKQSCYWFNQIPYSSIVTGGGGITGITVNGTPVTITNGVAAITAAGGDTNVIESITFNGSTVPITNKVAAITASIPDNIFIIPVTKNGTSYTTTLSRTDISNAMYANKLLFVLCANKVMPLRSYDNDDYGDWYFTIVNNTYICTMHLVSNGNGNISCYYSETALPSTVTESTVAGWGFTKNAAPGTLNTNNTSAQTASASEALSGTINLHKIAKTGSYNDLLNQPSAQTFIKDSSDIVMELDMDTGKFQLIPNTAAVTATSNKLATGKQIATYVTNTVPAWARNSTKPTYTASEVGALPATTEIPTESTVSGWGFTKNTGTYSKPSGGIPATDLASAVQTSLGKADTALQSFTETDPVFSASAAAGITSSNISTWNGKQDAISDLATIRSNASAGAAKVSANNSTITIQKNGTQVDTFTLNQSSNKSVNIQVNELPTVSSSDNGKVLQVVSGAWSLVTPVSIYSGSAAPNNSQGVNGDIYIQS